MAQHELQHDGCAAAVRLRRTLRGGSPVQHRRRGPGAPGRAPALCDADLAGPRPVGRARSHRGRRGERAGPRERRTAGRPPGVGRPRLHPARGAQLPRAGGFRHDPARQGPRRLRGAAGRRGQGGTGLGRAPRLLPQQRRAQRRPGHRQDLHRQQPGCGPRRARGRAADPADPAQGHADLRRLRFHRVHRCLGGTRLPHPDRGGGAGAGGDLAVPGQRARGADPGGDGAGVPGGRVHRAVCVRLLDQPADPARPGAVHRPGGGRCDRGGGEHPASRRPGRTGAGGGAARHRAGRLRGDRHHRGAGGGVPAGRLPRRQHRAPVPRTGGGAGRGGGDFRLRRADPDPDDVVQAAQGARARAAQPRAWLGRGAAAGAERALPARARAPRRPRLGVRRADAGGAGGQRAAGAGDSLGAGAGRGPRLVPGDDRCAGRRRLRLHGGADAPGRDHPRPPPRRRPADRTRQSARARQFRRQRGDAHRPGQRVPARLERARRGHRRRRRDAAGGTARLARRACAHPGRRRPGQ
ncbi:hypothetical protein NB717_002316 [Xanthomonas sacchari]|nr:hypothetical protein [Xanthomonas sacchari]